MSLLQRLALAGLVILVPILAIEVWFVNRSNMLIDSVEAAGEKNVPTALRYGELRAELGDLESAVGEYLAGTTDDTTRFEVERAEFETIFGLLEAYETSPADRQRLAEIGRHFAGYLGVVEAEVLERYSPAAEAAAVDAATMVAREQGRAVFAAIAELSDQVAEGPEPVEPMTTLAHLDHLAVEMTSAAGAYVAGDSTASEVFHEASFEFSDELALLTVDVGSGETIRNLRQAQRDLVQRISEIMITYDPADKAAAFEAREQLETGELADLTGVLTSASAQEAAGVVDLIDSLRGDMVGTRRVMVTVQLLIALAGAALIYLIARSYTRRLALVVDHSQRIAEGRPVGALGPDGPPEIEELHQALAATVGRLQSQQSRIEAADQARATLLSNTSHDLRTPLNVVLGYSEQLRRGELDETQQTYVDAVIRGAHQMVELIDNVVNMASIDAGEVQIESARFEIRDMLHGIERRLAKEATAAGLKLNVTVAADVPDATTSDRSMIEQVLVTLVDNAIRFTDAGSVTLAASQVGDQLEFRVEDDGPGVPEDQIAGLFQSAEVGDHRAKQGGLGLRLTVASRYAALLGGELSYVDDPRAGAIFVLAVPDLIEPGASPEQAESEEPDPQSRQAEAVGPTERVDSAESCEAAAPVTPGVGYGNTDIRLYQQSRVLVVDDHADNRNLLRLLLSERDDLVVDEVGDGLEAVRYCSRTMPDLILMDVHMPRLNGLEAIKTIRTLDGGADAAIIAISASAMEVDIRRAIAAGADGFLCKPVRAADLAIEDPEQATVELEAQADADLAPGSGADLEVGAELAAAPDRVGVELSSPSARFDDPDGFDEPDGFVDPDGFDAPEEVGDLADVGELWQAVSESMEPAATPDSVLLVAHGESGEAPQARPTIGEARQALKDAVDSLNPESIDQALVDYAAVGGDVDELQVMAHDYRYEDMGQLLGEAVGDGSLSATA